MAQNKKDLKMARVWSAVGEGPNAASHVGFELMRLGMQSTGVY